MKRTIAFDGSVLAEPHVTGVGRALLDALAEYATRTNDDVVLLLPRDATAPRLDGVRVEEGARGAARRSLVLPRILRRIGARLLHSPAAALPVGAPCPTVATVHDLPWMARPRLNGDDGDRLLGRLAIRHAARRATVLLCASRASRRDLLRFLGQRPRARVRVVHPGVPSRAFDAPDAAPTGGPLVVLSADRPRKNLAAVRRAHALAREQEPCVPDLELLGPPARFVPEHEKYDRLARATALLHFSLFEGFGLPIVEAFARGVPVACSDRASLREVAGDAAWFADPCDARSMADAIRGISTDHARRDALRARGLERARRFTAARTAEAWLRIHREVSA